MYHEILFAMCAVRILTIIGIVAVIAFATKSRAVLAAGALGSLLGYVVPERREYADGTAEAVFMYNLQVSADHILWCGVVGALLAVTSTLMVRRKLQYHQLLES